MKHLQKLLTIVIIGVMLVSAFAIAACTPQHKHTLVKADAKAATCEEIGNVEYWHCSECNKNFTSEAATEEIADVTVAALNHDYTVLQHGVEGHWYKCSRCEAKTDVDDHTGGAATHLAKAKCEVCDEEYGSVLTDHNYNKEVAEAKYLASEATCEKKATYYYSCECGEFDNTGKTFEVGELAAHKVAKVDAIAPDCVKDGNVEYWHCSVCGKDFTTEAATEVLDSVVDPALDHDYKVLQHSAEGHWYKCSRCEAKTDVDDHTGGTATHLAKAKCEVCDEEYGTVKSEHTYNKEVAEAKYLASEATCEKKATYYYSCECGEFDNTGKTFEVGELAAHKVSKVDAVAPECEKDGNVEYWHCSVCNKNFTSQAADEVLDSVVDPALDHDYKVLQHSAEGHWHKCSRCDAETAIQDHIGGTATHSQKAKCEVCDEEYGSVLTAHNYNKEVTEAKYLASEATCEKKATYYYSCECGEFDAEGETFEVGELAAHKVAKVDAIAPDCVKDGNVEYWHCSVCEKNFTSEAATEALTSVVAPALEHDYKLLQHSAEGHWYKCSRCEAKTDVDDHTGGAATHLAKAKCEVCGEEYGSVLTDHNYNKEVAEAKYLASEATCEKKATYYYSCECGEFDNAGKTFEVGGLAAHKVAKVDAIAPECEKDGNVEYWHCSVCGKNFTTEAADEALENVIDPATGHVYDKQVVDEKYCVSEATCEKKATYYFSCKCGEFDAEGKTFEAGELKPHQLSEVEAKDPDCENNGNVNYWYCSACEKNFTSQAADEQIDDVVLPAHHEIVKHEAVSAWKEVGWKEHWDCSVCDKVFADANGDVEISHDLVRVEPVATPDTSADADVFVGNAKDNKSFWTASNWVTYGSGNYSGYTTKIPTLVNDGERYLQFTDAARFELFHVPGISGKWTHLGENPQTGDSQWGNTGNFSGLYDNTFFYTFTVSANGAFAFEVFGLAGSKADRTGQGTSLLFEGNKISFFGAQGNNVNSNNQYLRAIATLPEDFDFGDGQQHTITLSIKRSAPANSATVTDYRIYIDGYLVHFVNQVNSTWNVANEEGILQVNIGKDSGMGQRLSVIPQINSAEGEDTTYTEVRIYDLEIKRHYPETAETETIAMMPECIIEEKYSY